MDNQTKSERFRDYHHKNPNVYGELRRLAFDLLRAGRTHYGMKGLFEVLRYEHARLTQAEDDFKINNIFTPYYARLLMANNKDLEGFFEVRSMDDEFEPFHVCAKCHVQIGVQPWGEDVLCWVCDPPWGSYGGEP